MIEVITSIVGNKDRLNNDQVRGNSIFTAFSDTNYDSGIWNIKPAHNQFKDSRRNSRIHKILIHKYSGADITIWLDGNIKLLISPEEFVDKYLTDHDMAIFAHPNRDCLYDEAITCAKLGLDDAELIIEQAKHYETEEFAKHKGLCEGGVIIRKNNQKTKDFNEAWWADYCRYSRRDQLSIMPAIDKVGINANIIHIPFQQNQDGKWRRDNIVEIEPHLNFSGNFNEQK